MQTGALSEDRKGLLFPLKEYIKNRSAGPQPIHLHFICTHNSRRSILAQVWWQTMAEYFGNKNVTCYSGGTEATAVYPMVIETLKEVGFKIKKEGGNKNPRYKIRYATGKEPLLAFSKKYSDPENPKSNFAAIMTCTQAGESCPVVAGSEKRITIPYNDPKISDGTKEQKQVYLERSKQIATEAKYLFQGLD